jgi:hypothetical protein
MAQLKLTADILSAALEGFEAQKNRIDTRIAEIRAMLDGGGTVSSDASRAATPKRKVSAAARRRMAKAQKLRWKRIKPEAEPAAAVAKPKRKLSAAARKRMAAAQKKRWAAIKGKSVPETAVAKKAPAAKTGQKATVKKKVVKTPERAKAQAAGQ